MGYTHYWDIKKSVSQKQFDKIVRDIQTIEKYIKENEITSTSGGNFYADEPLELFNGNGMKRGVYYSGGLNDGKFECEAFLLNGDASKNFDHETFSLQVGENEWCFCKTARKPYDLVVCLGLICLKYHIRSTKITSDGNNEDWAQAFELFGKIFNRNAYYFKFKEWDSNNEKLDGSLSFISASKATKDLIEKGVVA